MRHRRSPAPANGDTASGHAEAPRFPMWVAERGPSGTSEGAARGEAEPAAIAQRALRGRLGGTRGWLSAGTRVGGAVPPKTCSRDVEQPSWVAEDMLPFAQVHQLRLSPGRVVGGCFLSP